VALLLSACAATQVRTGPGSEYPCGVGGVECAGAMCCYSGEVCGGDVPPTCPANTCCAADSGTEMGERHMHPMVRAGAR
jgi:hypothetical protein